MPDDWKMQIERYKILHESVQNAHGYSWTMTGIYIPIAFGFTALLIQHSRDLDVWQYAMGTVGIECLLLFWFLTIKFLENCNKVRFSLLKKIEAHVSPQVGDTEGVPFEYYGVLYNREKRRAIVSFWISYKCLICWFARLFGLLVALSFLHKLLTLGGG